MGENSLYIFSVHSLFIIIYVKALNYFESGVVLVAMDNLSWKYCVIGTFVCLLGSIATTPLLRYCINKLKKIIIYNGKQLEM